MAKTKLSFVKPEDKKEALRKLANELIASNSLTQSLEDSMSQGPVIGSSTTIQPEQDFDYKELINRGLKPISYTPPTKLGDVLGAFSKGSGEKNDILGGISSLIGNAANYLGTSQGTSILGALASGNDPYLKGAYADVAKEKKAEETDKYNKYLDSVNKTNENAFQFGTTLQGQENTRREKDTDFGREMNKVDVEHQNRLEEDKAKADYDLERTKYEQEQNNIRLDKQLSAQQKENALNRSTQIYIAKLNDQYKKLAAKKTPEELKEIVLSNFSNSLNKLQKISNSLPSDKPTSWIKSKVYQLGLGDSDSVEYETTLGTVAYELARLTNPVGVLSDQDFFVSKGLLPRIDMDAKQRKAAFKALRMKYMKPLVFNSKQEAEKANKAGYLGPALVEGKLTYLNED